MTGLPWVRLDTAFPDNPKILALCELRDGHRAGFVYLCGLAYAGKHGTDGFIPVGALPRVNGRRVDAQRLVDASLWQPAPGGWIVHGWADKQESTEETRERSLRAQRAAQARWSKCDDPPRPQVVR